MACSTAVRLRSEARPRWVLILVRSLCWNGSSSRIDRFLPWPLLGCGALRSLWTSLTGTCWKLDVFAWDYQHGLAPRTRDLPAYEVEGEVVLRKACPALRPRAGNDVDALLGPLRHAGTGHVSQVDIKLQQPWRLLQCLGQQLHCFMLGLVCGADDDLASHMTIQVQDKVFLKTIEGFGAAFTAVPHVRILKGDTPIRGYMRLDALAPRATLRVWFGVLHDNLGHRVHDVLQGRHILHKALVLLQPLFPASDLG